MTAMRMLAACAAVAFGSASVFGAAVPARAQIVSPVDFDAASLGDVRLGVALATVSELVDTPGLLARASSQTFVADTFARLLASTSDPVLHGRASAAEDDLRVPDGIAFDRTRAESDLTQLTRNLLRALPPPRDRLCLVGFFAEGIAYNARVLRSPSVDAELRKALASASVADTLVPGLATMRSDLAALRRGRWTEIGAGAMKIVAGIVGAAAEPFPANDGVWVVLLRAYPVEGMTMRRGTPHLWLDVVRFDGSHRTIGAYPDDADFGRDSAHLACGFDREASDEGETAIPLVPPPGTSSEQLADALVARCAAHAKSSGSYRVRDASDARFVVDAMLAAGIDAAAVMREATGKAK